MRIIEWDADGKGGTLEITEKDYQESLRKHPHPLRVHSETGTVTPFGAALREKSGALGTKNLNGRRSNEVMTSAERQGSRSGNGLDKPSGSAPRPFRTKGEGLKSRERVNMDANELQRREDALVEEIVKRLPEFVRMCDQDVEVVMLHQDAFAAAYQDEGYRLLGMAIKYAGLRGKEIHIMGENRATLNRDEA